MDIWFLTDLIALIILASILLANKLYVDKIQSKIDKINIKSLLSPEESEIISKNQYIMSIYSRIGIIVIIAIGIIFSFNFIGLSFSGFIYATIFNLNYSTLL